MKKLTGNQAPRLVATTVGLAGALAMAACSPASKSQNTEHGSIAAQAKMDRRILSDKILQLGARGAFNCNGNSQTVSGRNDPNEHKVDIRVIRLIPKPHTDSVDAYYAQLEEPVNGQVLTSGQAQMNASKITDLYVSHEVVKSSQVNSVQFGAHNSFALYDVNTEERLVFTDPLAKDTQYYGTQPGAQEKPLTSDVLQTHFADAEKVVAQMGTLLFDCGNAVDKNA